MQLYSYIFLEPTGNEFAPQKNSAAVVEFMTSLILLENNQPHRECGVGLCLGQTFLIYVGKDLKELEKFPTLQPPGNKTRDFYLKMHVSIAIFIRNSLN